MRPSATAALVLSAANPLQQGGDGTCRPKLANKINRSDINPQFEGCCCDKRPELAALQAILGLKTQFGRKTSVMRSDGVGPKQLTQIDELPSRPFAAY